MALRRYLIGMKTYMGRSLFTRVEDVGRWPHAASVLYAVDGAAAHGRRLPGLGSGCTWHHGARQKHLTKEKPQRVHPRQNMEMFAKISVITQPPFTMLMKHGVDQSCMLSTCPITLCHLFTLMTLLTGPYALPALGWKYWVHNPQ